MKIEKTSTAPKIATSVDSANLESAKINLSKSNFNFEESGISSSRKTSNKSLYIGLDSMSTEEKKRHRSKIRRNLDNYMKDILGKDRTSKERETAVGDFLSFYKKNWKITDFKIESFSEKTNEIDLKNYKMLLDFVKSVIE